MKKGILLDETGEIMVVNGSMIVDDVTLQNQLFLLVAHKGEFKEYPTLGIGISDMVGDEDELEWKKRIREEFKKDDLKVSTIDLNLQTGKIEINAQYS